MFILLIIALNRGDNADKKKKKVNALASVPFDLKAVSTLGRGFGGRGGMHRRSGAILGRTGELPDVRAPHLLMAPHLHRREGWPTRM